MSFVFVALLDAVGQRISTGIYQQPQYYLRILVASVLGEPRLA